MVANHTPPTAHKVAQMQAAGYSVHERSAHVGRAWDWERPGKGPMDARHFASPEAAWADAADAFDREIARARDLMKHLDLKGAMKGFFAVEASEIDTDYDGDGGSTWMVDATFEADKLVAALVAAPLRDVE